LSQNLQQLILILPEVVALKLIEEIKSGRHALFRVAVCWQNEKGQKGSWSEIGSAIETGKKPHK
jgi:hypothetical protein